MDAEATAIIAAAEFLLPVVTLDQVVHFHFDASAVGFGAFGVQAIPTYHGQEFHQAAQRACHDLLSPTASANQSGTCACA